MATRQPREMRDRSETARRLIEAEIELREAERELEVAGALREKELALRQSQLDTNRALLEAGGQPEEVAPEPPPIPESLRERVRKARIALEELKAESPTKPASPNPVAASRPVESPKLDHRSNAVIALTVVFLSAIVLNLPIFLYGLIYDRYVHFLTSVFYFGFFLLLALVATRLCQKLFPRESLDLIFGLQVMLCFLPGLMIGCYFGSPYLKATVLQPMALESPAQSHETLFSGYYRFQEARLHGELSGSQSRTRTTKSGDSTTRVTTTYHVAPLTGADWQSGQSIVFWLVREGKDSGFRDSEETRTQLDTLATLSTSTLLQATEKSAKNHGITVATDPVFLTELPSQDRDWYGRYLAISLALLNLVTLGAACFLVVR